MHHPAPGRPEQDVADPAQAGASLIANAVYAELRERGWLEKRSPGK